MNHIEQTIEWLKEIASKKGDWETMVRHMVPHSAAGVKLHDDAIRQMTTAQQADECLTMLTSIYIEKGEES